MRRNRSALWVLLAGMFFLAVGCSREGPRQPTSTPSPRVLLTTSPPATLPPSNTIPPAETSTARPASTPARLLAPEITSTRIPATPTPAATATGSPTPSRTPPPLVTPPAGLMYCAYHTLWVVRSDGRAIRTMPCGAQISPDNRYALYKRDDSNQGLFTLDLTTGEDRYLAVNPDLNTSGPWREPGFWFADSRRYFYTEGEDYWMQDIWVGDITTGEVRNLTQTPERDEIWPMYWPGPDKVLFYSRVKEDIQGPGEMGYLTAMGRDGSGYEVLEDRHSSWSDWTVSPNGQSLAAIGRLYPWGSEIQEPSYKAEGIPANATVSLISPSWSPDSERIAWSVYVEQEGHSVEAIGVLDLESQILNVFHFFEITGGEGFSPAPIWSPDGQWLVLHTYDVEADKYCLWAIRSDGSEEYNLGPFEYSSWSPDSRWIAASGVTEETYQYPWIIQVGEWKPYALNLPERASVTGWIDSDRARNWANMTFVGEWWDRWYESGIFAAFAVTQAGDHWNIRDRPGLDGAVLVQLHTGERFIIINVFPSFSDRHVWWHIQVEASGLEGWIMENHTWFEPAP